MSPLASTTSNPSGGPYRKPRADVYTFMLIVALLAIILGIVCLYFEMKGFNFEFKEAPKVPPAVVAAALPACGGPALRLSHPTGLVPPYRTCA